MNLTVRISVTVCQVWPSTCNVDICNVHCYHSCLFFLTINVLDEPILQKAGPSVRVFFTAPVLFESLYVFPLQAKSLIFNNEQRPAASACVGVQANLLLPALLHDQKLF